MEQWLTRTVSLIGGDAVSRLADASVLLCGLGGVGGYVLEALARAGVGHLWLLDCDTVSTDNCNRQILALRSTVGRRKTEVARERVSDINPDAEVHLLDLFLQEQNASGLIEEIHPGFVVDAIDTVSAKIGLIEACVRQNVPVISCMGTGNKLDASRFVIGDLAKSTVCPLARAMRRELGKRGIRHVSALWSTEQPASVGSRVPSSISYVPAVAGLLIAGHVINRLAASPEERSQI